MSYLVLARKWRPKTFAKVIGQQHVLQALINGLEQDRLHHALLFSGTRGVGKTTLARILAKSINCEHGVSSTPCGECSSCQEIDNGRFVDLIEVDAASRTKVDDTRELLDNVQYAPSRGRYKVYLIDEVHMLSISSFNALLKTLEEPPPHVKFLFATTDPQKLPVTMLSRCLQFNLRRLEIDQITAHLTEILQQEAIPFDQPALNAIARAADGSMRDALSLLDQAISFTDNSVASEQVNQMLGTISQPQLHTLVTALFTQDGQTALQQSAEFSAQGRDFKTILNELLMTLQQIATLQLVPGLENSHDLSHQQLAELSQQISAETVQLLYQIALHGKRDLQYAADPKSGFDMTLLRMLSFQPKQIANPQPTDNTTSTPSKQNGAITVAHPPHYPQTTNRKTEPKIAEPTPAPFAKQNVAATTNNSDLKLDSATWIKLIGELKLTAFARQLADNSAFIKFSNKTLYLTIAAEFAHLATDKAQQRLAVAIGDHLQQEISLIIQQGDHQQAATTLATERAQQDKINQQNAIDAINNDPAVAAIKEAFDAQVIESTIKPR